MPSDINFLEMDTCDNDGAGVPDAAPDEVLTGFVDWDILRYSFREPPFFPAGAHGQGLPEELDRPTADRIKGSVWRGQITRLFRYDAKFICGVQTDPKACGWRRDATPRS